MGALEVIKILTESLISDPPYFLLISQSQCFITPSIDVSSRLFSTLPVALSLPVSAPSIF